ncbi:Swt1 family HEPN domain-containing protein [Mycolicibacterium peregrinum]|uniref:Swt1 family HEPN domain-containing protein n=1 Tax=Mycolicibacterium peregrinum TaxID=43304 RepID=UPI003AAF6AFE
MDPVDHHSLVGQALPVLARGLAPFVTKVLAPLAPAGGDWSELIRKKDAANGRGGGEYRSTDPALMLRAMTERLGDAGYPFTRNMPRQAEIYAKEMREVRNKWAHTGQFSAAEAYRAIDSAELLLRTIGVAEQAEQLAELKATVSPLGAEPRPEPQSEATQTPTAPKAAPLPPTLGTPRIDIAAIPDLSYAMAHCRIPVIDHITIDNTGGVCCTIR